MRIILLSALFLALNAGAQNVTFWTENFGAGCNSGTYANGYFSFMTGIWTVTSTGFNESGANEWFISAEENGNDAGECGSACGNDPSLHLGADGSLVGTDLGAAYYEGLPGFCDIFECGATDKRAESPVINCSGMSSIVLHFNYIEGGNAVDNATLWYYDGSTWAQLADMPKTDANVCAPQGVWTEYSIALPFSSTSNTNVKIGFRWVNNDDGQASDPSFAVDDIYLTGDFGEDVIAPVVVCPGNDTIYTEDYCAVLGDYIIDSFIQDDVDPFPMLDQNPQIGTDLSPGNYTITVSATDNSGNYAECSFGITVIDDDAPVLTCVTPVEVTLPIDVTEGFVEVATPDVMENCGSYTLVNDFDGDSNASGIYPVGITNVTYTATDESGNLATCIVEVNVSNADQICCVGDFNCDGIYSVSDLLVLLSDFGCTGTCQADIDFDGLVGVSDLQMFTALYGIQCP